MLTDTPKPPARMGLQYPELVGELEHTDVREKYRPQTKAMKKGTCKPGERADLTGCTPATPEGPKAPESKLGEDAVEPKAPQLDPYMQRMMNAKQERGKKMGAMKQTSTSEPSDNAKQAMDQLQSMLGMGVTLGSEVFSTAKNPKYRIPLDYVIDKGEKFYGRKLPKGIKLGTPQECYSNATQLLIMNPDYRYVEGFAMAKGLMPVLHGWCIDKEGNVIDNTFKDPENAAYIGVVYDRKKYLKYIEKTKYYGVLGGSDKHAAKALEKGSI